ncbi:MAG: hypothetical protein PWP40_108 [Rhodocyclaceae bacterium]|nr:hypothetical protein [Rhodocyclaceae bacterium]
MSRAERIIDECKRRELTVERTGNVWRIFGRGVDIRVLHLEHVDLNELNPLHPGPRTAWREAR